MQVGEIARQVILTKARHEEKAEGKNWMKGKQRSQGFRKGWFSGNKSKGAYLEMIKIIQARERRGPNKPYSQCQQ